MKTAYLCSCGGLAPIYDARRVGALCLQHRAKCVECGRSMKVLNRVEKDYVILRTARNDSENVVAESTGRRDD